MKKMNIREPTKNNTLKSSYYIMKSLFYSLLYHNDKICIKYFNGDYNKLKDKFVFIENDFTEKLSKVFFLVINNYDRKYDLTRTIIFDFFVKKIFEILLLNKKNFYYKNLYNLKFLDYEQLNCLSSENFLEEFNKSINKTHLEILN